MPFLALLLLGAATLAPIQAVPGAGQTLPADTTLAQADAALAAGAFEAAAALYLVLLKDDPNAFAPAFGLARATAYAGRPKEAIAIYDRLLTHHPQHPDLLVGRGFAYLFADAPTDALADFRAVAEAYPTYADAWRGLARAAERTGDDVAARTAYAGWIAADPSPDAYVGRARLRLRMNQVGAARDDLEAARSVGADAATLAALEAALRAARPRLDVSLLVGYETFAAPTADWRTVQGGLAYRKGRTLLGGGYLETHRFGSAGRALSAEAHHALGPHATGQVRLQRALAGSILPNTDFLAAVYRAFGPWEPAVQYRLLAFEDVTAHLGSLALARYAGAWYLRGMVTVTAAAGEKSPAFMASARRYLDPEAHAYIDARAGWGREVTFIGPGPRTRTGAVTFAALIGRFPLAAALDLTVAADLVDDLLGRHGGLSIGFVYGFGPARQGSYR